VKKTIKEHKMTKKRVFLILLGFVAISIVTAESNRAIFNSWVGHHYTKLAGNIAGRPSYNGNSVTYDSSWTEDERVWKASGHSALLGQGSGEYGMVPTGRKITYERWVTFYFDGNGIITTWRSYGWKM
jgi:hypothetical protein